MSDMINRQDAIDALLAIDDHGNSDRANALGLAEFAITVLPVAEPSNSSVIPNSSDVISRQAAIEVVATWLNYVFGIKESDGTVTIFKRLRELPSAEPQERKTGRWIDMGDCEQCSACKGTQLKAVNTVYGKAIWIKSPYCPNCGARMEVYA